VHLVSQCSFPVDELNVELDADESVVMFALVIVVLVIVAIFVLLFVFIDVFDWIESFVGMSQVSSKQSKPKKCIYYCKLALLIEKDNIKAIFRYGKVIFYYYFYFFFKKLLFFSVVIKALRLLQDFDSSRSYFMKAMHLQPTNKEISVEIGK
jgi:hypothetical protein